MTPSAKRQAIALLVSEHRLSVVRACQVARLARAAWYRPPPVRLVRDGPVIAALTAQVEQNPRWGFWKLFDRLHNLGQPWNPKRVHRVYCALGLNRRRRTKRPIPRRPKVPLLAPPTLNQTWALDSMRDTLYDSRVFRTLNVLDQGNRECLAIEVGFSLPSRRVIALLDELVALHGAPATLRLDNGPEFLALRLSDWAEHCGISLDFIQPGRSLAEVRAITRDWLRRYNTERPHDSLGRVPPLTFLPRETSTPEYQLQVST
jgi:putative transposase